MEQVFELTEVTKEQMILKINATEPLVVAKHPYVNSDMAYITVTRGWHWIITIIRQDGTTWSFSNGTLIADSVNQLRAKIFEFAENNNIDLRSNKM